ncbi:MAG: EAL domain-containing protein [Proteobacteria bacterium]|nr:EAL domain-containing protein [Pseudomonadota bacterium]
MTRNHPTSAASSESQTNPGAPEHQDVDVLLIEDSQPDVELAILRLNQGGFRCRYRVAITEHALRSALGERLPDFILSDFSLPGFDGLSALSIAREAAPDVPFLFLSGTMGEERAIEALRRGAVDYVLKSNPKRLVPAVTRALAEAELRRASRAAERRLARLTEILQMLSEINTAVVRIRERKALLREACRLAHRIGGYPLVIIATADPTTHTARVIASASSLQGCGLQVLEAISPEKSNASVMNRILHTGEAALCNDIAESGTDIQGREALLAAGVRSLICLPLTIDQTAMGALLFVATEPNVFSTEELKLLREVAANLSFALQYLDKQDAAHFLTYFDPLTGLAKRTLFCERLGRLLTRHSTRIPQLAVEVFDIDHLSVINDSYGRHVGDRLLQRVADRLKRYCPDTDRLAHLGGGTFVNFIALGEHPEEEVHTLHQAIAQLLDAPIAIDDREIAVTVKCGIARYPQNGDTPDELVQNAEAALKEAKTSGERYLHHRLEMNSALAERVHLEFRLRSALQNQQFELYYQPKVRIATGQIVGVEALLRWNDPEQGVVGPAIFLPILETAGLLPAISSWVVRQAVADCLAWRQAGLAPMRVAVNISPSDLRRRGFVQETLNALEVLSDDPQWGIDIEVTEGALFGDSSDCVQALRWLRSAGMRIFIDDFGTGYSSLSRLSELPIDSLKIDRTFTCRLPDDPRTRTLVSMLIGLAHTFGLTTVAEGVETADQLEFLTHSGCDESQGYLHSHPLPKASFEEFLRNKPAPTALQ